MTDRTAECRARLAAFGVHLTAHGFHTELTAYGLVVRNLDVPGCCRNVTEAADTIVCRPRLDDAGILWYFTSWCEPLAPADQIQVATAAVKGHLSKARR